MFCPKCGTENPETGRFCRSCGTDLSAVAGVVSGELQLPKQSNLAAHKVRGNLKDKSEIFGESVRNILMGVGFLVVSIVLFTTGVAGGKAWWWAMLFPAFAMLAKGISEMVKFGMINDGKSDLPESPNFTANQPNQALPPIKTDYIKPRQESIYTTGELIIPSSVTENTTRQLQMNSEGETMTLPKVKEK